MSDGGLPEPAMRFRIAQSWWIASELMRRHSGLKLIETHPSGGLADCLSIMDLRGGGAETIIDLNRHGAIHVERSRDPGRSITPIGWADVMSREGPRGVVMKLESCADFGADPVKTRTTRQTVGFRLAAGLLSAAVNDRERWDVRNEYWETSGFGGGPQGHVQAFGGSRLAVTERRPDDPFGIPEFRYWAVSRGGSVVAVFDTDGLFHSAVGTLNLMELYKQSGRSISVLIGDITRIAGWRR